jgi:adenylylsulfate kinase
MEEDKKININTDTGNTGKHNVPPAGTGTKTWGRFQLIELLGTGGMESKIRAGQKASLGGVPVVIANGSKPGILKEIFRGKEEGTLILPQDVNLCSRKRWIAFTKAPKGELVVDRGAEKALLGRGVPYVQRLDGDIVRKDLTRDLGFSRKDRDENIRRVTFVAELLSRNGVATLVSFISPYREARAGARARCHNFIEVYVKCDPEILAARDVKGLYKKSRDGTIANFTGIDDPYEEPPEPEIVIDTGKTTVEEGRDLILSYLEQKKLVPPVPHS